GGTLLAMVPPGEDDEIERDVLSAARGLGAIADRARLDWALARAGSREDAGAAGLWAEALTCMARTEPDAAVKQLRKAALGHDSPRRAAALKALGDLGERRAEVEVLRALGSTDTAVYAEAARAAVLIQATGGVTTLVANLEGGVHVRATSRALSLAGPTAVGALLGALPTTRGEGAFRTAVAGGRQVTGTIRAALARALATVPESTARALDPARLHAAMELTVAYTELPVAAYPSARPGL